MGDHQRADGVVAGAAAGVADDVGVALGEAGVFGRVEARVHAGEDGEAAAGRHRQVSLVEARGILAVGGQHLVDDLAHGVPPPLAALKLAGRALRDTDGVSARAVRVEKCCTRCGRTATNIIPACSRASPRGRRARRQRHQFGPRVVADRPVRPLDRLLHPFGPGDAANRRGHARVAQRELQRRRACRHAVPGAHRLDAADGIEHFRRRLLIDVVRVRAGPLGEHAGGVGGGVEDGDALADGEDRSSRSALRLASVKRLWVMRASKSQSRNSGVMTSTLPAARPTASTSPSSFILNRAASAPSGRGDLGERGRVLRVVQTEEVDAVEA